MNNRMYSTRSSNKQHHEDALIFLNFLNFLLTVFIHTISKARYARRYVLKQIWGKLGLEDKNEWDFEKDPCSPGRWNFFVVCDCSFESNTTCRVTQMYVFRSYPGSLLAKCELGKTKSCS
ncbi:hypothetical protein Hanom_Chr16g01425701 [Helianthus anomalus]